MWFAICASIVLAAASPLSQDAARPATGATFPSEEAVRRYARGRLLEERGAGPEALAEYYRALLLDDRAGSILRRVSEVSARNGGAARSLEFAERAVALDSADARAQWLRGTALLNLGRSEEALSALRAATLLDSSQADYYRTLAHAAEELDRVRLVAECYHRVVWLDDEDGEAWFQAAAAEARLGRFAVADSLLAVAIDLNPLRPGVFFLKGWVAEALGHTTRARELYRQHLAIHPGDQATRKRLVGVLTREKRYAEGYREARALAQARPDDLEARQLEADLAFDAGSTSEGLRLLRRLAAEHPDALEVQSLRMRVLARHGRAHQVVGEVEAWARQRPNDAHAEMLVARALQLDHQLDPAIHHLARARSLAPDSLAPRVLLARALQDRDRLDEAEREWTEAAQRFPEATGVRFDLALCRERRGNLPGAEEAVRDVLAREPDNATALNFLGYLLADHNLRLEEAVKLIERALELDPDNSAFLDSLGWAFYRLGRLVDARSNLELALQLGGADPIIHEHLGDVYNGLMLKDMAREQYRLSLAGSGTNPRVRAKLSGLR